MYPIKFVMFPDKSRYSTVYSEVSNGVETVYKNYGKIFLLKEGTTDIISERQINENEVEDIKKYIESSLALRKAKRDEEMKDTIRRSEEFRREVEEGRTW